MKIIAEIGWNHMGDIDLAKKMIDSAAQSGADYAKFQTWSVKNLSSGPWDEDGRRQIYEKAELNRDEHLELKGYCDSAGIKFLTSCFNTKDLVWLRDICDEVKIASTECNNIDLVERASKLFSTVFMSTGTSKKSEWQKWKNLSNIIFLHCVSSYPCPAEVCNMKRMIVLQEEFGRDRVGYSGHYEGIEDAIIALSNGAIVVEKHFTTDNRLPGRDNKFAILPTQLSDLVYFRDIAKQMLTNQGADYQSCEQEARDLYAGRWS